MSEQGNSHKIREKESKEVPVSTRRHDIPEKKANNGIAKKAENFVSPIVDNVIIPAAQDTIIDIVQSVFNGITNAIVGALTGQEVHNNYNVPIRRNRNGRTNYNRIYTGGRSSIRREDPVHESTRLRDLRVNSHDDAVSVIEQMYQLLDNFGQVSCNDLYGLTEIDKTCPYTYTNYGWTNLDNAGIINNGDGTWSFDLPKPTYLGH